MGVDRVAGFGGAYDFAGDTHAFEFRLVVGAGFGAVVCYEDDLFACLGMGKTFRGDAGMSLRVDLCSVAFLMSQPCPRIGDRLTIVRLCFSSRSQYSFLNTCPRP